jgi:hypothetical protein
MLITQYSDEDCVVAEITYWNTKFNGMSLYFDVTEDIEINIRKTEQNFKLHKGARCTNNS